MSSAKSRSSKISAGAPRGSSSQTTVAPRMRIRFWARIQSETSVLLACRSTGIQQRKYPALIAPDVQSRLVYAQKAQGQLRAWHRPPGQNRFDTGKRYRRLPLRIGNPYIKQGQIRIDTSPGSLDLADAHTLPEFQTRQTLDIGPIVFRYAAERGNASRAQPEQNKNRADRRPTRGAARYDARRVSPSKSAKRPAVWPTTCATNQRAS